MPFQYESVMPWGRSFDEYRRMFALAPQELNLKILGCGDGPAAFNAAMARLSRRVVSCDPLYQLSCSPFRSRIDAAFEEVMAKVRENYDKLVWTFIQSPEELGRLRIEAMEQFLSDFALGKRQGRYVAAELPHLPFPPATFDIALCSHFLFLYSDRVSLEFHLQSIEAMCAVAREARIFPLLTYNAELSPHLEPLLDELARRGYRASVSSVPYEFLRGADKMLKVSR